MGRRARPSRGRQRRGDPVGRAAARRSARSAASRTPTTRRRSSATATSTCSRPTRSSSGSRAPFELVERDGWLYARGIADDKGQLYMLLKAAELLAAAGELPVNLRFACDGEEEIGGHSIVDWIARGRARRRRGDRVRQRHGRARRARRSTSPCAGSATSTSRSAPASATSTPACTAAPRSTRCTRCMQTLSGVLPRDGRLPEPLRVGHRAAVASRARGLDGAAGRRRRDRRGRVAPGRCRRRPRSSTSAPGPSPSVDVHGIAGGSPILQKTVIPVEAEANVSIRLVGRPGSRRSSCPPSSALLREAAPDGAEVEVDGAGRPRRPGSSRRTRRPSSSGSTRSRRCSACGRCSSARAARSRSSPRSPRAASPTILTGFALNESNIHSPNERIPRRVPAARDRDRRGALPPPRRAWVAPRSPLRSQPSSPTGVLERFLRYVRIDTQADEESSTYPSTAKQLDLSRLLVDELREIGLEDVELTEHGYVFATLPGTPGAPVIGLIAHVDTTPESPGAGRRRRSCTRTTTARRSCCPATRARCSTRPRSPSSRRGSGTTSSRATARRCSAPTTRPAWPRSWPPSRISREHAGAARPRCASRFTVDEEVGRGTDHFDLEAFGAEVAYTLDGSGIGELEIETFSARQLQRHDPRAAARTRDRRRASS